MSTPLPQPQFLLSLLNDLERQLFDVERNFKAQVFVEKRSADQKIRIVTDGSGRLKSVFIDPTLFATPAATLAANVKDVVNQALSALNQQIATAIGKAAFGWSLPGLPAPKQTLPDFGGFSRTVDGVTAAAVAAGPCSQSRAFTCRSGPVTAVANACRQLTSLSFDSPLPALAAYLENSTLLAVNCAIDQSTDRVADTTLAVDALVGATAGFRNLVLYANNTLTVDDQVVLKDQSGTGFGFVGNAGSGATTVGLQSEVGNVLSVGAVTLKTGSHVHGFVRTSSSSVSRSGAIVDGPVDKSTVTAMPDLALNVAFPAATTDTIVLTANQTRTAGPAYYDKISVAAGAKLTLTPGVFFCNTFLLDPGGQIILDARTGPIFIYVKTSFTYKGAFVDFAGATPNVFVGYVGTTMAVVQSRWTGGVLVAPSAKIDIAGVASPGHLGAFHGKDVEVHSNTTVRHQPSSVPFEKLPGLVPPTAPFTTAAQLGLEDTSGWGSPQATLSRVTSPIKQGASSLKISGIVGSTDIFSPMFSTAGLSAPTGKLRLDLYISANPPSPTPIGQIQVFITIPAANVYGASVGSANLNALPRNAYSTIQLSIPPTSLQAINNHLDAQLKIVLAVVSGSGPYFLDNIRFA